MNDYVFNPVNLVSKKLTSIGAQVTTLAEQTPPSATPISAEETPAQGLAALDGAKLRELETFMPPALLEEILSLYFEEVEKQLVEIAGARTRKDYVTMGKIAHTLVSTTGNLGALHASATARHLEIMCRTEDYQNTYHIIGELIRACDDAATAMKLWQAARAARTLALTMT